jgi:hypothetical protein
MTDAITLTYRATGGRPPVDLEVLVCAPSRVDVRIGTSFSVPIERVSRVGSFGSTAPAARLAAVHGAVLDGSLLDRNGAYGQWSPEAPRRAAVIDLDGRHTDLQLDGMSADAGLDTFERAVQQLALDTTVSPIAAIEGSLELALQGDTLAVDLVLRSIGTEPVHAVFADAATSSLARVHLALESRLELPSGASMPMPAGGLDLHPDEVAHALQANNRGNGPLALRPDDEVRVSFPPTPLPTAAAPTFAYASIDFWEATDAGVRNLLLVTQDTRLPA